MHTNSSLGVILEEINDDLNLLLYLKKTRENVWLSSILDRLQVRGEFLFQIRHLSSEIREIFIDWDALYKNLT